MTSASRSALSTRSVTSSRLPIGVGQTTSRPLMGPSSRPRLGADRPEVARGPEARGDDPYLVARRHQRALRDDGPGRLEQEVAGRDETAADRDDLGVEDVDEAGHPDPEV